MFAEDLSVFFDTDDFAVTATLDGTSINGIFDNEFIEQNFVQTSAPVFTYRAADKAASIDSVLVCESVTYKVKGIEPDGTGLTKLILEKQ